MTPDQLKFTKTHEWISPEGKVGISEHAQKEITDVVFVELPKQGKTFLKEEEACTIESVKAAFPIYAPAAGKIIQANAQLANNPGLINQSPYENGWLFQLEISNPSELNTLMSRNQYQEFLKSEVSHH